MKWIEGKKTDPEAIREALKKGYRTEHPERTAGYCGFFFSPGDVYLSCRVAEFIRVPEFRDFVLDALAASDAASSTSLSDDGIYVKQSEVGRGTTFRIELRRQR